MEEHVFLANFTDFLNRLNRADFVVGIHYRYKAGIRAYRLTNLFRVYDSVFRNRAGYLESVLLSLSRVCKTA